MNFKKNLYFFTFLIISFKLSASSLQTTVPVPASATYKIAPVPAPIIPESVTIPDVNHSIVNTYEIDEDIDYSYAYDQDNQNFMRNKSLYNIISKTKKWLILVNLHADMPLNLTSSPDSSKRTLKWTVPVGYFVEFFDMVEDVHRLLALPTTWSQGAKRAHISFIFIPPGSNMIFKIGYAAPQKSGASDYRGEGIQMRLHTLPKGSIVMVYDLTNDFGMRKELSKADSLERLKGAARKASHCGQGQLAELQSRVKTREHVISETPIDFEKIARMILSKFEEMKKISLKDTLLTQLEESNWCSAVVPSKYNFFPVNDYLEANFCNRIVTDDHGGGRGGLANFLNSSHEYSRMGATLMEYSPENDCVRKAQ